MRLPKGFEDRMRELLGEEYEAYLQCYNKPHFGGLRVNTLKTTPEDFEKICPYSLKRIPWIENGYYYHDHDQPSKHPYYYAGLYYIQEPSAMTPASLLPIQPGDKVLDICAAPGGKSTELGAKLRGEGVLVSNDISNSRAKALLKNVEMFGIRNALVVSEAPDKLARYFLEYFDKILIDAPCSGEGMFRKSSDMIKNWEQNGVTHYSEIQKEIILSAASMLKAGGTMLYSTCTFSPEENEGTISYLLEHCPEFRVVKAIPDENSQKERGLSYEGFDFGKPNWIENGKEELKDCIRLWPHKVNGEGHFVALLYKEKVNCNDGHESKTPHSVHPLEEEETNCICLEHHKSGLMSLADDNPQMDYVTNHKQQKYKERKNKNNNSKSYPPKYNSSKYVSKENIVSKASMKQNIILTKAANELSEEAMKFIDDLKFPMEERLLEVRDEKVYLMPKGLPDLKGLRLLRQGFLIGEMKKQRFEPSQALANGLKVTEYAKRIHFSVDDTNVIRYLKGETITLDKDYPDGWYLVCVDDYPLGWLKVTKSNVKNKYQPGWRLV